MTSLSEFHRFTSLPPELRAIVWLFYLPQRFHDYSIYPLGRSFLGGQFGRCRCRWRTTHRAIPILSQVCRDSRELVLRRGRFLNIIHKNRDDETRKGEVLIDHLWFQPRVDIVHIRPLDTREIHFEMLNSDCRFSVSSEVLLYGRHMSHICIDYLLSRYPSMTEQIFSLEGRSEYHVIISTTNIYAPRSATAQASGPLELLADAPLQLIDPDDLPSIRELHALHKEYTDNGTALEKIAHDTNSWEQFSRNIQLLRESYTKIWVWCCWRRDLQKRHGQVSISGDDFDQVWVSDAKPTRNSRKRKRARSMTASISAVSDDAKFSHPPERNWWPQAIRDRCPNPENPWVAQVIATMPVFHPKILVRFCQDGLGGIGCVHTGNMEYDRMRRPLKYKGCMLQDYHPHAEY